jgi:hypothetical protein
VGLRIATGTGEIAGPMNISMIGRYACRAVVDIKMADPYFYEPFEWPPEMFSSIFSLTVPVGGTATFVNPGDANIIPDFHVMGDVTNLVITNQIYDTLNSNILDTITFTYTGTIPNGTQFRTLEFRTVGGGDLSLTSHDGSIFWMEFANNRSPILANAVENRLYITGSTGDVIFYYKTPVL